jgi:hypothetical protein
VRGAAQRTEEKRQREGGEPVETTRGFSCQLNRYTADCRQSSTPPKKEMVSQQKRSESPKRAGSRGGEGSQEVELTVSLCQLNDPLSFHDWDLGKTPLEGRKQAGPGGHIIPQ